MTTAIFNDEVRLVVLGHTHVPQVDGILPLDWQIGLRREDEVRSLRRGELAPYFHSDVDVGRIDVECLTGCIYVQIVVFEEISSKFPIGSPKLIQSKRVQAGDPIFPGVFPEQSKLPMLTQVNLAHITGLAEESRFRIHMVSRNV